MVGEALRAAEVDRESVVVATKGGYVPFDGEPPADPLASVREQCLDTGLLSREDLARGRHALAPAFLSDQLDRSPSNLGLDAVDLYYVHNPATQRAVRSREAVYDRLEAAFTRLEERAADGDIRH